jgi:glycosyltransferase involved in cell wall biosynthesis
MNRILAFATQGAGGNNDGRLRALLQDFPVDFFPFDRRAKPRSFLRLLLAIRREHPDLVVVEGTGLAGGLAVMLGRLLAHVPYVVSSGDAVGPFVATQVPSLGPLFGLYERLLCRWSAGFIGWTPYLVGRALSFGAPLAMTAAGWAPILKSPAELAASRVRIREQLGIPNDALVFGIVGSLAWTKRVSYCYGYELVEAIRRIDRPGVVALIVGEGDGRARLEKLAGKRLGHTVVCPGAVERQAVPDYLAAMDVASLPQSVDQVGSSRYTTKLSEYLAAGRPIITGQIPLAYDLAGDWLWRLPGKAPWDERYLSALAHLMRRLTLTECRAKQLAVPRELPEFDKARQVARVTAFLTDMLNEKTVHQRPSSPNPLPLSEGDRVGR